MRAGQHLQHNKNAGTSTFIDILKRSVRLVSVTIAAFFGLGGKVECEVGDIAH